MLFYELPKEKPIYGPMQIEAMIDQNTTIAQQLTLWDKRVESHSWQPDRGAHRELLPVCGAAVPDGGRHGLPQLKRVIVISGDKVAMEPTLDEAIQAVVGTQPPQGAAQAPRAQPGLGQARAQFDAAQKAMQQGDWETLARRWTRSSAC